MRLSNVTQPQGSLVPGYTEHLVECQVKAKGIMIKQTATEKKPELADEGQKKKRKDQNIETLKFIACGSISLKSGL